MVSNTLKKQIGQLFIIGYQGEEPDEEFLRFVEEWGVGGVIVFARNLNDPSRLPATLAKIEQASGQKIFSAIDQEGGLVLRILKHGSLFPSAMGLGAAANTDLTEKVYTAIGSEMLSLGLNWNLAPVLDINHPENPGIGARSFSEIPEQVALHGASAIRGLQKAGVLACAKHFPGKGHAKVDSHLSLPIIPYDKARLEGFELYPFKRAIANNVDAIMTAHVYFPAFESEKNLPATLSRNVLTGLLRDSMNFNGLIVTDDLEMGAITESFGIASAAEKSFFAGADLLLICHQLEQQRQAAEVLLNKITNDKAYAIRLEESLARISQARGRLKNLSEPKSIQSLHNSHHSLIETAHDEMLKFLRFDNGLLPLQRNSSDLAFFVPEISALVQVEEDHGENGMENQILHYFPKASCYTFNPRNSATEILNLQKKPGTGEGKSTIVFMSYNAHLLRGQIEAIKALSAKNHNIVVIALRNPYDLADLKDIKTLGASFSFRSPAVNSILKTLGGELPVKECPWPIDIKNWN